MRRILGLALGLLLVLAPAAIAQVDTGTIYGTVTDESGAILPGASVTLSGEFGTRSTVADRLGQFRFLNVDHGRHSLTVTMPGFAGITRDVRVSVGVSVAIDVQLEVAAVEEVLTVTAETPVIDAKEFGTSVNIRKDELEKIPTSRDPWALMRTIPGILVDRVNVAGSESGQQSYFSAKGADDKDTVWTMDGITITDEVSMSSPSYFTYDSFDEINFQTGAQDISIFSGGAGINLVTKRGTNTFHGSAAGYFTHDDLQWGNVAGTPLEGDARLQGNDKADHTEQINDLSFDIGGPIVKDTLWFYGSFGRNDVRIRRLNQTRDKTVLKNFTGKLNWQAGANDMVSLFWFNGMKVKEGRKSTGIEESDEHLWNQGNSKKWGPEGLSKVEWNHVFSPELLLNVKGAYYNTGFILTPRGGLTGREVFDNVNQIATGPSYEVAYNRPQYTGEVEGSYFKAGWGGNHELKFGAAFRRNGHEALRTQPGDKVRVIFNTTGTDAARFYRDGNTFARSDRWSIWLGDTFVKDRATVNVGVRFDRVTGRSLPATSTANPAIPGVMPDLDYSGTSGNNIEWNNLQPRVGLTYALDESRRTLLRASYSRYAGLLSAGDPAWDNPVATAFLEYGWTDTNGDRDVQLREVDFTDLIFANNVDPGNPTAASSPNLIDPDFKANTDDEFVVGLEREVVADLAVSAAYTFRKSHDLLSSWLWSGYGWYPWLGSNGQLIPSSQFLAESPVTEAGYTATTYLPSVGAEDSYTGGALLMNRDDYSRTYNGAELALTKRLSNRWMGRVALTWANWVENVGPGAIQNPTRHDFDPLDDGGQVVVQGGGSGKINYRNAKWQLNVNGMYQVGMGFEVAANLFARQGYPNPVYLGLQSGFDGFLNVLPDNFKIDDRRHPDLWLLDLRLAKTFKVGEGNVILSAELFNVFNDNVTFDITGDATSAAFGRINEILAPRIARFGARFTF